MFYLLAIYYSCYLHIFVLICTPSSLNHYFLTYVTALEGNSGRLYRAYISSRCIENFQRSYMLYKAEPFMAFTTFSIFLFIFIYFIFYILYSF